MVKHLFYVFFCSLSLLGSLSVFAQDANQKAIDDKILTEYFVKNKIRATKTASGLYYVIKKQGSGPNAKSGKQVTMNYIGKFLSGKVFDANVDETGHLVNGRDPLKFTLGVGQVIRGWDEGVQLLNPGTTATLYLPSGIAYGPNGRGPIPANSILVFDVELLAVAN